MNSNFLDQSKRQLLALFAAAIVSLVACVSHAAESRFLRAPRGASIEVMIHTPDGKGPFPTLIVASSQNCAFRADFFEALAKLAVTSGFAVIRFEWAYCQNRPTNPTPSSFLIDETEDFQTVFDFAKNDPRFDSKRFIFAGKSQGSFVAHTLFKRNPEVLALVLITPVCTYTADAVNRPLPSPIWVGDANYPNLKSETRPVLMLSAANDKSCVLPSLYNYLRDTNGNIYSMVIGGDHAFKIYGQDGNVNLEKTQFNVETGAYALVNWISTSI